jgi:hypothetical protein|tara:strand:- start:37 stop:156 length:120 start_codon:yes stop_codon:yes gene_type:complete
MLNKILDIFKKWNENRKLKKRLEKMKKKSFGSRDPFIYK